MRTESIGAVTDDGLPINNSNIDVATSTRAVQSDILSDATPFDGADVGSIYTDTTTIRAVTDGIPVLSETGGTITTDGTVQTIYINNAPTGVHLPMKLAIDFTNHTAGETVDIEISYRIKSGGNLIEDNASPVPYAGAVTPPLVFLQLQPNRYGIQITIEKTAGANRAYDWAVFYEA